MGAVEAREDLLQALLDRYYPVGPSPAPQPPADFTSRAGRFTGAYVSSRSNYSTPEKVTTLFQPLTVSATPQGTLLASYGPIRMQLVEIGPLEFRSLEDQSRVVFQENQGGQIAYLFFDSKPEKRFIKLPWHASPSLHLPLLIACLALFVAALIAWPIRLLAQRRQARASEGSPPLLPRFARWVGIAMAMLNLTFSVSIVALFMSVMANPTTIPSAMPVVMAIPVVTALLGLSMFVFSVLAWKNHFWKVGGRLFYSLVTLAALVYTWIANFWHLWIIGL